MQKSLLHLAQLSFTQINSEIETINNIINDILFQAEKKNADKKNDETKHIEAADPVNYMWSNDIPVHPTPTKYTLRSSKEPNTDVTSYLRMEYQNINPTLKLHDILPRLNNYNTQTLRYTRPYFKKTTTTIKPKHTYSKHNLDFLNVKVMRRRRSPDVNQSTKMKISNNVDVGTTPVMKKTKQKENLISRMSMVNIISEEQLMKKFSDPESVFSNNISNGPHEQQFSGGIFGTTKDSFNKDTKNLNHGIVTKGRKANSTESTNRHNKLHDNKIGINSSPKTSSTNNKEHYGSNSSIATSITEKEWSSLKDAEDFVKSIPNYKLQHQTSAQKSPDDKEQVMVITTDMAYKYGGAVDNGIDAVEKQSTAKLLDKRISEYQKVPFVYTTDAAANDLKHKSGTLDNSINLYSKKTTAKLNERFKINNNKHLHFKSDTIYKHNEAVDDVHKKKTTSRLFDNKVTEHKEKNTLMKTDAHLKQENALGATFKYNDALDMHSKQDVNNINIAKDSLDVLLQKISAMTVTRTGKNYDITVPLDTTEEIDLLTPFYETTKKNLSSDLYLLVEPKDKSLKSYFTLESAKAFENVQTTTDDSIAKLLSNFGFTTEYNDKLAQKLILNDVNVKPVPSTPKVEAPKKGNIADLYKDVIEKYEIIKEEHLHSSPSKFYEITKHINWEKIKKFFGHDRVCNCKCKANKTMCTVCSASDSVMRELSFEFTNLADYMNAHCTEIQTFFWMNPSGGKKLRDTVHRIDKTLEDYYKRVKGKCAGRTCKTFSTYLDKRRYSDKKKLRRKYLKELLQDLEVE